MILVDTHALYWFVQGDEKLGKQARTLITRELSIADILVSAVTIWEVAFAVRRGKLVLNMDVTRWTRRVLNAGGFKLAALEPEIAIAAATLDWTHKDPADRFIVATALHWDATLLTADRVILAYAEAGHVQAIDARR